MDLWKNQIELYQCQEVHSIIQEIHSIIQEVRRGIQEVQLLYSRSAQHYAGSAQ